MNKHTQNDEEKTKQNKKRTKPYKNKHEKNNNAKNESPNLQMLYSCDNTSRKSYTVFPYLSQT